jgi:hypothetical protein
MFVGLILLIYTIYMNNSANADSWVDLIKALSDKKDGRDWSFAACRSHDAS